MAIIIWKGIRLKGSNTWGLEAQELSTKDILDVLVLHYQLLLLVVKRAKLKLKND
jgi:hypothetical protein